MQSLLTPHFSKLGSNHIRSGTMGEMMLRIVTRK
jgi:hypothetical protein